VPRTVGAVQLLGRCGLSIVRRLALLQKFHGGGQECAIFSACVRRAKPMARAGETLSRGLLAGEDGGAAADAGGFGWVMEAVDQGWWDAVWAKAGDVKDEGGEV